MQEIFATVQYVYTVPVGVYKSTGTHQATNVCPPSHSTITVQSSLQYVLRASSSIVTLCDLPEIKFHNRTRYWPLLGTNQLWETCYGVRQLNGEDGKREEGELTWARN